MSTGIIIGWDRKLLLYTAATRSRSRILCLNLHLHPLSRAWIASPFAAVTFDITFCRMLSLLIPCSSTTDPRGSVAVVAVDAVASAADLGDAPAVEEVVEGREDAVADADVVDRAVVVVVAAAAGADFDFHRSDDLRLVRCIISRSWDDFDPIFHS